MSIPAADTNATGAGALQRYLGDVGAVRPGLQFDALRAEDWLRSNVAGYRGPATVRQFDGGQSNPTYLMQTATDRYVLRRRPPGALLKSAHAVDREFRVMSALAAQGFPVPAPLALCEDETA